MNLDKILDFKVVFVMTPGDKLNENTLKIAKKIKNKKVCYITLNKGVDVLRESFRKEKINNKNFFFIDCVSKMILSPKSEPNCIFISSPKALTELALSINKAVSRGFSVILFDCLSTFMIYNSAEVINHFFHSLANKVRADKNENLILVVSDKEKNSDVFRKIEILVDKVVELK